jgi:hypothetical protein
VFEGPDAVVSRRSFDDDLTEDIIEAPAGFVRWESAIQTPNCQLKGGGWRPVLRSDAEPVTGTELEALRVIVRDSRVASACPMSSINVH